MSEEDYQEAPYTAPDQTVDPTIDQAILDQIPGTGTAQTIEEQLEDIVSLVDGADPRSYAEEPQEYPEHEHHHNSNFTRTRLHEVMNENWNLGFGRQPGIYAHLVRYVNPQTATKNKDGFHVETNSGGKIQWSPLSNDHPERISIPYESFNQEAAAAMVSLGRLRGWRSFELHGETEHKEIMWLEIQRQNLREKEAFEQGQKNGTIPKDKQYQDLTCNFEPLPDSKVMQIWQKELNEYNARKYAAENAVKPESSETPVKNNPVGNGTVEKIKNALVDKNAVKDAPVASTSTDIAVRPNTAPVPASKYVAGGELVDPSDSRGNDAKEINPAASAPEQKKLGSNTHSARRLPPPKP